MRLKIAAAGERDEWVERRLLLLAAGFILLYALALTLSPAVRARSWQTDYRWDHWIGVLIWLAAFGTAHVERIRRLPEGDPFLLPLAGLLSGWGMLTIWRLLPGFGLRQALWLGLSMGVVIAGMRLSPELRFLRRFKYLWLTGGLALTALTLVMGVNPMGYGPRMWLGCCGVYLQPSEPLKLLLIAYLAGYLAEAYPLSILTAAVTGKNTAVVKNAVALLPLLASTFIMVGLAMVLLMVQRDLGTASIFFFLYAAIVYIASGRKSVLLTAVLGALLAGGVGYLLFDVVRVRVDAWLNPWLDPSGRSFQIVQAVLAIASGGLLGRGPGMGNPGLVPVVHSDLIFAAVAEEQGLVGSLGLLLLYALLAARGLRAALLAADAYRRYLAAGLTAYLIWQGVLIIGGSLRMLPLTGVTLPFFSYGGSSLLVSCIALLLLLRCSSPSLVSARGEGSRFALVAPQAYQQRAIHRLGAFLLAGLAVAALLSGWWAVVRGPDLLTRTDNPRRAIGDRSVRRGAILDRENKPINVSAGNPGDYQRLTTYPDLSGVVGYTDPTYGQSGLEASLDGYLRGLTGNSGLSVWMAHILYGQPPPGLDVRTSLDLNLQSQADALLAGRQGALVLLNAQSGEILAMASHPTFDANQFEQQWDSLVADPATPLLNRAVLGQYPLGDWQHGPFAPAFLGIELLPAPETQLSGRAGATSLREANGLSPLQVALLAAALTADGIQPAPRIVLAVDLPSTGWVMLSALEEPRQVFLPEEAQAIIARTSLDGLGIWQGVWSVARPGGAGVTWYLAGTLPGWNGAPFALAILLEEVNPSLAQAIGQEMLTGAMRP